MTNTPSAEQWARLLELLAETEKLIETVEAWAFLPVSSGVSTTPSAASSNTTSVDTNRQRRRAIKPIEGLLKFKRRIMAELEFLQQVRDKKVKFKKEYLSCSNLTHYAAIVDRIIKEGPENVSAVSKVFHLQQPPAEVGSTARSLPKLPRPMKTEVDIVCKNKACWIKVKAMSAEGVSAVVNGTATGSRKSVLALADDLTAAARFNLIHYKPPVVVFHFSRGLSASVHESLVKRGVFVEGDIVELEEEEWDESDSEKSTSDQEEDVETRKSLTNGDSLAKELKQVCMPSNLSTPVSTAESSVPAIDHMLERDIKIVNLDVTTLITMVSNVTNGGENDEFADELLSTQAAEERVNPTLPQMWAFFEGKDLVVTEMALEKFLGILRIVGGPQERERGLRLFPPHPEARIRVVPNTPSPLLQSLRAPRVKEQHRVIFGTGHALQATTATANFAFTATAKERGVFLSLYLHPARALTEQKSLKQAAAKTALEAQKQ